MYLIETAIKSLVMILLSAFINSSETFELQEINKDEEEKIKRVGGRKTLRNDKGNANKSQITNGYKA